MSFRTQPQMGGPPARGLGERLITPYHNRTACYKKYHKDKIRTWSSLIVLRDWNLSRHVQKTAKMAHAGSVRFLPFNVGMRN
jgi:hypothetical protein